MKDNIEIATEIGDHSSSTNPVGTNKEETKNNLLKLFNKRRINLTTLKQRYEQATGYETRYNELLSHVNNHMTDLENDGQEESKTYEQMMNLYKFLSSDEGRNSYSEMSWDDVSSRLTEEELEKVIEVQTIIGENLDLLSKSEVSSEGRHKIDRMLADATGAH